MAQVQQKMDNKEKMGGTLALNFELVEVGDTPIVQIGL